MTSAVIGSFAFGVGFLALTVLAWSGRWRSWATTFMADGMITVVPAIGVVSLLAGVGRLVPALYLPSGALMLVIFAVGIVASVHLPSWWGPRWYHELKRSGDDWTGALATQITRRRQQRQSLDADRQLRRRG